MEMWKDITGYEGLYQVSSLGKIRSISHDKELIPRKSKKGYLMARLSKSGIIKQYKIHRLVAIEFLPNPDNKTEVNHINYVKMDNRLSNLEWNTSLENNKHRSKRLFTYMKLCEIYHKHRDLDLASFISLLETYK
jgi:hypothetical protein